MHVAVSSDIAAFADDWPTMASRGGFAAFHAFQTRDYLDVWRGTIGAARGAELIFVRVADASGNPLLLVPLAIERRRGLRILRFPDGGVSDYNAPILFPGAASLDARAMTFLWRRISALVPQFDAAILDKMPGLVGGLANPFRALASDQASASGHVLDLSGDWNGYVATRLHRPKDSRRKRRRLAELGEVQFVTAKNGADANRLLRAMVRHKTRRYLETRGVDGFDRPGYRTYFQMMTDRFGLSGEVHLSGLELNGDVIAAHWGLVSGDRFYCLMLSNAEGPCERASPGRLLVEDLIAWSFGAGLKWFDLGVGDADWKDRLGDTWTPLWRAAIPHTLAGKAYLEATRLRRVIRAAAARGPEREPASLNGGGMA
jgi:CelD/BcsL family acetyltransferase involved in cellulose biosynthesis